MTANARSSAYGMVSRVMRCSTTERQRLWYAIIASTSRQRAVVRAAVADRPRVVGEVDERRGAVVFLDAPQSYKVSVAATTG